MTTNPSNDYVPGVKYLWDFYDEPLAGIVFPAKGQVAVEKDYYPVIREACYKSNWNFIRLETVNQAGVPDILVTRGDEYWLIEVKLLRKKILNSIENDLHFQFGQLGFMARMLKNNSRYMLVVITQRFKKTCEALWIRKEQGNDEIRNYPDFTKLL